MQYFCLPLTDNKRFEKESLISLNLPHWGYKEVNILCTVIIDPSRIIVG